MDWMSERARPETAVLTLAPRRVILGRASTDIADVPTSLSARCSGASISTPRNVPKAIAAGQLQARVGRRLRQSVPVPQVSRRVQPQLGERRDVVPFHPNLGDPSVLHTKQRHELRLD